MNPTAHNTYETALKTSCITQQPLFFLYLNKSQQGEVWHKRLGNIGNNGRNYDVYEFDDPVSGKREKVYFDITCFFGKGSLLLEPKRLNLPPVGDERISVMQMFGNQLIDEAFPDITTDEKEKLNSTLLHFNFDSSDMLSNYVAMYDRIDDLIEVLPFRRFHELKFPVLHGFHFYILFIIHQLSHIHLKHDFELTESEIKGNSTLTALGEDCILFTPLPEFTFANDFVNYLFWTHKPTAFKNENEQQAFKRMAKFALTSNLFSREELHEAISNSSVNLTVQKCLSEIISS